MVTKTVTPVRIDHTEILASRLRGSYMTWQAYDVVEVSGGWVWFELITRHVYAPYQIADLPQRFIACGDSDRKLRDFLNVHGRLGGGAGLPWWDEYWRLRRGRPENQIAEPIAWHREHIATMRWCLEARAVVGTRRKCPPLPDKVAGFAPRDYVLRNYNARPMDHDTRQVWDLYRGALPTAEAISLIVTANIGEIDWQLRPGEAGGFEIGWVAPDLRTTMYVILAEQLIGSSLRKCEWCGLQFRPSRADQIYCPGEDGRRSRCSSSARKQKQREGERRASGAAQGQRRARSKK